MIEAYVYSSCTSCRKTDAMLTEAGVDYLRRDYSKDRFSRDELASILERAGLALTDVLSTRSRVYKERGEEIDATSDDGLLDLMLEEPTLLRRPLVTGFGRTILGHHPSKLSELIDEARQTTGG